jgi:hypothetical protein
VSGGGTIVRRLGRAATHDAAVQMIDTSIIRVHEQAAFTRNVETDGLPERLQPPIIAHATTISAQNASKPSTVRWLRDMGIFVITSSRAARIVWINAGLKLGMGASPQLRRHSRRFLAQRQAKVS